MEWSNDEKRMKEYLMCFTYEPDKKRQCIGASGRKLRRVCVWCPNYKRPKKEKEGHCNGNES